MEEQEKTQPTESELLAGGRRIAGRLTEAGFEAWFVGGCVRDQLLDLPLKDIDIATDATPDQAATLFPGSRFVGARFGVLIVNEGGINFEVTTFRRDGLYLNHRHPETVEFGTMEDDSRRRDFTINALYQDPTTGAIRDLVGGQSDLEGKLLRCVGDARLRFKEDALRLLRAVRFATRLDFQIEEQTWEAMCELAPTIEYISPERHREELTRILTGPAPGRGMRLMDECGLLHFVLPEIEALKGVEQGPQYHPEGDVFVHTCLVLDKLELKTPITVWAALLHDVGKPATSRRTGDRISFHGHESVGAKMARQIMRRFRASSDETHAISDIVASHMKFIDAQNMKRSTLRRFIGRETIDSDLALHRADALGSNGNLEYYKFVKDQIQEFAEQRRPPVPPPLLNGNDLIAMGYEPGSLLGIILAELQEKQLEEEITNITDARRWVLDNFPF